MKSQNKPAAEFYVVFTIKGRKGAELFKGNVHPHCIAECNKRNDAPKKYANQ
jgi:hypothetical protein